MANRSYRGDIDVEIEESFSLNRCESSPAKPVLVTHAMGEAVPRDVIWTTMAIPLVVSQRFIDILLDYRFTGWSIYPVEVHDKTGKPVPGYHGFCITGRCGPIDLSKSEVVLKEYPGGWFPVFRGTFFDPASWDGSDFFMEREVPEVPGSGSAFKYVTDDVRKALRKARIGNLMFERLSEQENSPDVYEMSFAERLPADFAERVAAAYKKAGVPVPERYQELVRKGSHGEKPSSMNAPAIVRRQENWPSIATTTPLTSKPFPGFDRLFALADPLGDRPYRGNMDIDEPSLLTRCESLPPKPILVNHAMGEAIPRDVIWTTMATPLVVSQRFIDILLDYRFTGWSTYLVEVRDKTGKPVPGYHGFCITGRCDPIDLSKSEVVLKEYPGGWFPVFKGTFFDPASWDGSDLFTDSVLPGTPRCGSGYVTDDVRKALRKARIGNLRFERLSEQEYSPHVYEISLPERLPADFAERVAASYKKAGVPVPEDYQELVRKGSQGNSLPA